jgi:hypothetical protein
LLGASVSYSTRSVSESRSVYDRLEIRMREEDVLAVVGWTPHVEARFLDGRHRLSWHFTTAGIRVDFRPHGRLIDGRYYPVPVRELPRSLKNLGVRHW